MSKPDLIRIRGGPEPRDLSISVNDVPLNGVIRFHVVGDIDAGGLVFACIETLARLDVKVAVNPLLLRTEELKR